MDNLTKECTTCKASKDLEAFGKHPLGKYGRKSSCKECVSLYQKNLYQTRKLELEIQEAPNG